MNLLHGNASPSSLLLQYRQLFARDQERRIRRAGNRENIAAVGRNRKRRCVLERFVGISGGERHSNIICRRIYNPDDAVEYLAFLHHDLIKWRIILIYRNGSNCTIMHSLFLSAWAFTLLFRY